MLGSLVMGLIYSVLTVTLRANQNVTGLALTTFGVGFGNFFGGSLIKLTGSELPSITLTATSNCFKTTLPFADKLGWFGDLFLSYSFLAYVAVIIAVAASYFFNKTRAGLSLRSIGENPATADAAGINVTLYKYLATCIGAGISGIGGVYYILDYNNGIWNTSDQIEALGWLAVALVIFTTWRPLNGIWGAYLFGVLYWLYQYLPNLLGISISTYAIDLVQMIPYVVTIVVLIVVSLRKKRENQPPASLGIAYFREER
jgi:simple sugar transport system permease protein